MRRWKEASPGPGQEGNRTAFSLVELLVVVSIVTLLAAFLLPGLSRAREYAYFTSCKNSLKQISIGCLIYASDNRGRLPGGEIFRCQGINAYTDWHTAQRIGSMGGSVWYGGQIRGLGSEQPPARNDWNAAAWVVWKLYDDWERGEYAQIWTGEPWGHLWIGRPRLRGRYLPIEALWDPITKVRGWELGYNPPGIRADTEKNRDRLARGSGALGYAFFIHRTGCYAYRTTGNTGHVLGGGGAGYWQCEMPFRPATNSKDPTTSHRPSVWLAACMAPNDRFVNGSPRYAPSHFGCRRTEPGNFRFNVLHLDGHVHDGFWQESDLTSHWLFGSSGGRPYGWPWKNGSGSDAGLVDAPALDGAYDRN